MGWFNFLKKKAEIQYPLDSELIRRDRIVRALTQEKETLKAQISELLAEKRQEQESEREEDREELFRQNLKGQEIELKKQKFGKSASLRAFFSDKKLLEKTEICDKDDNEVFGKFGDILILDSGRIALTDTVGNVLSYGNSLSNVIFKPGTFINQLRRGRILIPYDKEYNPVIDFEEIEINDIKYDNEEKCYKETLKAKETAKKLLIERDMEIRRVSDDLSRIENVNIDMAKENDELKRTVKLQKGQVENTNSELSTIMNQFSQFQMAYGDIQRKLSSLTEIKAMNEEIISRYENTFKSLLEQFEESGDKTNYQKAITLFKTTADYVSNLSEKLNKKIEETKPKEENPQKIEEKR